MKKSSPDTACSVVVQAGSRDDVAYILSQDFMFYSSSTYHSQSIKFLTTMEPSLNFVLCAFAACVAFASANVTPVGSLYAYGKNISGLPLFYADGLYQHLEASPFQY